MRNLLTSLTLTVFLAAFSAAQDTTPDKPLGEKQDAQERTWGLLQSGILGSHGDLWLAEIELSDERERFERPAWLGEEVTADPAYANSSLASARRAR